MSFLSNITRSTNIVTIDLEGCLVPEIWVEFAKETGIKDFEVTTAHIPKYEDLMKYRLKLLTQHGIRIQKIQEVISRMEPLPGAVEFLTWLRKNMQCIILSDTFYELANPLMQKLHYPSLFCHNLILNNDGTIKGYKLRVNNPKKKMVRSLQKNGFYVIAIGDSFNDTTMLKQADTAFFFRAKEKVLSYLTTIPNVEEYSELKKLLQKYSYKNSYNNIEHSEIPQSSHVPKDIAKDVIKDVVKETKQ